MTCFPRLHALPPLGSFNSSNEKQNPRCLLRDHSAQVRLAGPAASVCFQPFAHAALAGRGPRRAHPRTEQACPLRDAVAARRPGSARLRPLHVSRGLRGAAATPGGRSRSRRPRGVPRCCPSQPGSGPRAPSRKGLAGRAGPRRGRGLPRGGRGRGDTRPPAPRPGRAGRGRGSPGRAGRLVPPACCLAAHSPPGPRRSPFRAGARFAGAKGEGKGRGGRGARSGGLARGRGETPS